MADIIQVTQDCTVFATGAGTQSFTQGESVDASSPWYIALINSGYASDTGIASTVGPVQEHIAVAQYHTDAETEGYLLTWDSVAELFRMISPSQIGLPGYSGLGVGDLVDAGALGKALVRAATVLAAQQLLQLQNSPAYIYESSGQYPLRSNATTDASRMVIWVGPDSPPGGTGFAVSGVDIWFKTV